MRRGEGGGRPVFLEQLESGMVNKSLVAGGGISNMELIRKQPAKLRELQVVKSGSDSVDGVNGRRGWKVKTG